MLTTKLSRAEHGQRVREVRAEGVYRRLERRVSHVRSLPTWAGRNEHTCVHTSPDTTTTDKRGSRIEDSETTPSKRRRANTPPSKPVQRPSKRVQNRAELCVRLKPCARSSAS